MVRVDLSKQRYGLFLNVANFRGGKTKRTALFTGKSDGSDWSENLSDWSKNRSDCSEDFFSFLIAMFGCQNGKMYLCDPKFQNNYN